MKFIQSLMVLCGIALAQADIVHEQELFNPALNRCILTQIDAVLPIGSLPEEWEVYRILLIEFHNKAANGLDLRYVLVYFDSVLINLL